MNEVAGELALISNNELRLSSKLEFVSASSSDVGIPDVQDKLISSDKKVHWNCKYVQLLLDCVESRMHEFKNKSIHKKVWDDIGKEMQIYGFSTEHCYNKWKNLRRDVRMFAINPNKATKNQETLNRVKKLISTICPNFDPTAVYKKSTKSPNKHSEESSNSLEPLTKLLTPPTSPFSDILTPINNDENMDIQQDSEAMMMAAAGGDANNLLDMKLNLSNDVYSYLLKQQQHNSTALLFHHPNLFLNAAEKDCSNKPPLTATSLSTTTTTNVQCLQAKAENSLLLQHHHHHNHHHSNSNHNNNKKSILDDSSIDNRNINNNNNNINNNNINNSSNYSTWPYELYDLLVSFRTEEVKQAHSIDQLIRQINEIRDSSVRRMNTIQQLMNLANLLINSKIS